METSSGKYGSLCANVYVVMLASLVQLTTAKPFKCESSNPKWIFDQPGSDYPSCLPNTSKYAAIMLNRMYMAFDLDNDDSLSGITAWMSPTPGTGLKKNILCSDPPAFNYGPETCNETTGVTSNCQLATGLYNHNISIDFDADNKSINKVLWSNYHTNGIVFNQQLVENELAKCAYAFLGGTSGRWNSGCGVNSCTCTNACREQKCCPTHNLIDNSACTKAEPATECTPTSYSITGSMCNIPSQNESTWSPPNTQPGRPLNRHDTQCFWNMPNLVWPVGKTSVANHLREMLKHRVPLKGMDENSNYVNMSNVSKNRNYRTVQSEQTEIVLDARPLINNLIANASKTVLAFVFQEPAEPNTDMSGNQKFAVAARELFCKDFDCGKAGHRPPIVMWKKADRDFTKNTEYGCGPFYQPKFQPDEGNDRCSEESIRGKSLTPSPTPAPTASPTPAPTPSPTPAPTHPTPSPTPAPTHPTPSPTPAPTPSPTPAPTVEKSHPAAYVVPLVVVGIVLLVLVILGFLFWGRQAGGGGAAAAAAAPATEMGTTA